LAETALAVTRGVYAPLEGVPGELSAAVDRCLARNAADRFGDVAELARALAPLFDGGAVAAGLVARTYDPKIVADVEPTAATVPDLPPSSVNAPRRRRPHSFAAIAVVAFAAFVIGVGVTIASWRHGDETAAAITPVVPPAVVRPAPPAI